MDTEAEMAGASTTEARFVNCLRIGHTAFEFIFDFGQRHDGQEYAHLRMVTYPVFAKAILEAMVEAVKSYEQEHGRIQEPNAE